MNRVRTRVSANVLKKLPSSLVTITGTCSGKKNILLRIPSWAEGATLRWGSTPSTPVTPGTLHPTSCEGNVEMELILPMKIRVTRRYNNAASIYCGSVLLLASIMVIH